MRYRALSPSGDYLFGRPATFLVNSPAAVAQLVKTRLGLYAGEWFLDTREGLDLSRILGYGTQGTRDIEIKRRILDTPGVRGISAYSSTASNRRFLVSATIDTIYGAVTIKDVAV